MKMDRNLNSDGKGKYAIVRLRGIQVDSEAYRHLKALEMAGVLDWGCVGEPDEFFVVKLRDKYADAAIQAYSDAVAKDARNVINDDDKYKSLMQWSLDVQKLASRAGILSPFCKQPD